MPLFTVDPLVQPGYYDVFMAAGQIAPGVCKLVSGGDREYNWDVKQAPGIQGYVMTYRGWKGGEDIVMRFEFFEHPDGPSYQNTQSLIQSFYTDFLPLLAIDAQKVRPSPVVCYHPALAANNITQVVAKKIGSLQTDGHMRWWVDVTFLEFRPPRLIQTATPMGATAALGQDTPQSKIDQALAQQMVLAQRPD